MNKQALTVFWSVVVQRLSMLVITILSARLIGADELGKFVIAYATCVNLTGFIGESLAATISKQVASAAHYPDKVRYEEAGMILSFCVVVALGLGVVIELSAPMISRFISANVELAPYIRISGVMTVFALPNTVINAMLNAFCRHRAAGLAASAGSITSLLLGLLGAYYHGAIGVCVGFATGTFLLSILYLIVVKRQFSQTFIRLENVRNYFASGIFPSFTFPTMATMALGGPVHWLCMSFLGSTPTGVGQIAIFAAMFQWYSILTFIPAALVNFTLPWLARAKSLGGKLFRREALHIALVNVLCAAGLMIVVLLLEGSILRLYGPDFRAEGLALRILAVSGFVGALTTVMNQILWASGKTWSNLLTAVVYGIAYVAGAFTLVKYGGYGVTGLTASIMIASVVQGLLQGRYLLSFNYRKIRA